MIRNTEREDFRTDWAGGHDSELEREWDDADDREWPDDVDERDYEDR